RADIGAATEDGGLAGGFGLGVGFAANDFEERVNFAAAADVAEENITALDAIDEKAKLAKVAADAADRGNLIAENFAADLIAVFDPDAGAFVGMDEEIAKRRVAWALEAKKRAWVFPNTLKLGALFFSGITDDLHVALGRDCDCLV